jgi:hypothetical protein
LNLNIKKAYIIALSDKGNTKELMEIAIKSKNPVIAKLSLEKLRKSKDVMKVFKSAGLKETRILAGERVPCKDHKGPLKSDNQDFLEEYVRASKCHEQVKSVMTRWRMESKEKVYDIALKSRGQYHARNLKIALELMDDRKMSMDLCLALEIYDVIEACLDEIKNNKDLIEMVSRTKSVTFKNLAVSRITDEDYLVNEALKDPDLRISALSAIKDQEILFNVVTMIKDPVLVSSALDNITSDKIFIKLFNTREFIYKDSIIKKIKDQEFLKKIALDEKRNLKTRDLALKNLEDKSVPGSIDSLIWKNMTDDSAISMEKLKKFIEDFPVSAMADSAKELFGRQLFGGKKITVKVKQGYNDKRLRNRDWFEKIAKAALRNCGMEHAPGTDVLLEIDIKGEAPALVYTKGVSGKSIKRYTKAKYMGNIYIRHKNNIVLRENIYAEIGPLQTVTGREPSDPNQAPFMEALLSEHGFVADIFKIFHSVHGNEFLLSALEDKDPFMFGGAAQFIVNLKGDFTFAQEQLLGCLLKLKGNTRGVVDCWAFVNVLKAVAKIGTDRGDNELISFVNSKIDDSRCDFRKDVFAGVFARVKNKQHFEVIVSHLKSKTERTILSSIFILGNSGEKKYLHPLKEQMEFELAKMEKRKEKTKAYEALLDVFETTRYKEICPLLDKRLSVLKSKKKEKSNKNPDYIPIGNESDPVTDEISRLEKIKLQNM